MYELNDGSTGVADVFFEGNGGVPFGRSDLNADGTVDVEDWVIFLANSDTVFTGLTSVQAYLGGDLDGDFDNDFRDFRLFKSDFIAIHGAEAFAILTGVPEPATAGLLLVGLAGLAARRRKHGSTCIAAALSVVMAAMIGGSAVMAADPVLYVASDDPNLATRCQRRSGRRLDRVNTRQRRFVLRIRGLLGRCFPSVIRQVRCRPTIRLSVAHSTWGKPFGSIGPTARLLRGLPSASA